MKTTTTASIVIALAALSAGHAFAADTSAQAQRDALRAGAALAASLGLEVHAGHGIDYDTVEPVAAIPQVMELNIGHFLIGEAIFVGLPKALAQMRAAMDEGRQHAG